MGKSGVITRTEGRERKIKGKGNLYFYSFNRI